MDECDGRGVVGSFDIDTGLEGRLDGDSNRSGSRILCEEESDSYVRIV